jgi:hypothetical protein
LVCEAKLGGLDAPAAAPAAPAAKGSITGQQVLGVCSFFSLFPLTDFGCEKERGVLVSR